MFERKKIKIKPKKGGSFYIARYGDSWLLNKVLNNKEVIVEYDKKTKQDYIVERGIYLRQGTSDTTVYQEIFINGCYDICIKKLSSQKSIVVDLGSHIGVFSTRCSPKCKQVFAYEAQPDNYNLAVKNIKNKSINNVKLYNLAAWSSSGQKIKLASDSEQLTGEHAIKINSSSVSDKEWLVKTIAVEDIFNENNIKYCDLLKLDIEGAEYEVLFSTPSYIFNKTKAICLEYHPDLTKKHTKEDLEELLKGFGFRVYETIIKKNYGILYATK
ncbi:MAG: FkbM family methyltransferase [Patescibacteria group bacterium]